MGLCLLCSNKLTTRDRESHHNCIKLVKDKEYTPLIKEYRRYQWFLDNLINRRTGICVNDTDLKVAKKRNGTFK